jgi:hypothetical protein
LNPPHPGHKLFEELILDFDISQKDRRKYDFWVQNVLAPNAPNSWIDYPNTQDISYSYLTQIMNDKCVPERCISFWNDLVETLWN